jgi:hypothetical protein
MLAEKWGVPPYQLERDITPYWFNRAKLFYDELNHYQTELQEKAKRKTK